MTDSAARSGGAGVGRLIRHRLADRVFHWIMAASVLTLLVTSFLPIVGVKFAWVMPHWIAGVVLAAVFVYHVVRASVWQDLASMWVGLRDLRDAWSTARWILMRSDRPPPKPGKYPLLQKLYHHAIAAVIVVALATGLMMMVRVDTPFWKRDPYWLSDQSWGVVYVLHGFAALAVLALVTLHIYFAVRPEKLWITRSMIFGWISREQYLDNHDPARWTPEGDGGTATDAAPGEPSAGVSARS